MYLIPDPVVDLTFQLVQLLLNNFSDSVNLGIH